MSGTSADAIDAALVRISGSSAHLKIQLKNFHSSPYPPQIRQLILNLASESPTSTREISQLNFLLGELFARAALALFKKSHVKSHQISAIGSHGQTVFHQGRRETFPADCRIAVAKLSSTLQLAEPAIIAARTGILTVADFRPADMALGGQGAPLVPFVDYLLFRHATRGRVALNIGGIANLTIIPPRATPQQIRAFDTGPGNMVIDALTQHATHGRQNYDRDAALARRGRIIEPLLDKLLRDPYFRLAPPKSAGREQFGAVFTQKFLQYAHTHRASPNDLIHTATLLTAISIANAISRFAPPRTKLHDLIVSGGGSQNPLIMAQLAALLPHLTVHISDDFGLPSQAKEALAFAVLAHETLAGQANNLPSATGARTPAILGKLNFPPPLKRRKRK
jgi:anhydro-N-acetylmuramic acid kinase